MARSLIKFQSDQNPAGGHRVTSPEGDEKTSMTAYGCQQRLKEKERKRERERERERARPFFSRLRSLLRSLRTFPALGPVFCTRNPACMYGTGNAAPRGNTRESERQRQINRWLRGIGANLYSAMDGVHGVACARWITMNQLYYKGPRTIRYLSSLGQVSCPGMASGRFELRFKSPAAAARCTKIETDENQITISRKRNVKIVEMFLSPFFYSFLVLFLCLREKIRLFLNDVLSTTMTIYCLIYLLLLKYYYHLSRIIHSLNLIFFLF